MNLNLRLKCVADRIRRGSYPADIGTDHAYIPIYLIKNEICGRVIATDIRRGPLLKAEKNILEYGIKDRILLAQGPGLTPVLNHDIDCAILAGMGGRVIRDILEDGKSKAGMVDYFVIQPVQYPEVVREYLYNNNYSIQEDRLIKENGRIYQVMTAVHGTDIIDDCIFFEFGKKLIENKDPLLHEYIEKKISELKKVIEKTGIENSDNAGRKFEECTERLKKFEEVLRCL
jgi:Predicted SAM-dependent methyltransferase